VGLLIGTGFELVLRVVRAHLLDTAGKKTDVILRHPVRTHHRHGNESQARDHWRLCPEHS
jgi:hypothetical protein